MTVFQNRNSRWSCPWTIQSTNSYYKLTGQIRIVINVIVYALRRASHTLVWRIFLLLVGVISLQVEVAFHDKLSYNISFWRHCVCVNFEKYVLVWYHGTIVSSGGYNWSLLLYTRHYLKHCEWEEVSKLSANEKNLCFENWLPWLTFVVRITFQVWCFFVEKALL